MSIEVYQWSLVVHVFAWFMWVGVLLSEIRLVIAIGDAGAAERPALVSLARSQAMLMDIGATLAIGTGLWLALGGPINWFSTGGWLHAKLTVVVLLILVPHVLVRIKIGRYKRDQDTGAYPAPIFPLVLLGAAAIMALVIVKPF